MGLFDKKYCDICGEKIGFLQNRRLEDGNLCKSCAAKLSPFFCERRRSTIEEIRAQLAYREENAEALKSFHPDIVFGEDEKVCLDMTAKKMIVTSLSDFSDFSDLRKENPDIIGAEQIISCETDIEDSEEEIFYTDKDGNERSFSPPRYRHAYEFHVTFKIDSPWFDEICVDLNPENRPESKEDDLYVEWQMRMSELKGMIRRWNYKPCPGDMLLGPDVHVLEMRKNQTVGIPHGQAVRDTKTRPLSKEPISADEVWKCSRCGTESAGKFCPECGMPRE